MDLKKELIQLNKECQEKASCFCEYDSLYNKGLWKLYPLWCEDIGIKTSSGNAPRMFMDKVREYEASAEYRKFLARYTY